MQVRIIKPKGGEETRALERDRITVGRAPCCALVLEGEGVSRLHAVIERTLDQKGYSVSDLSSARGTLLNGTPVEHAEIRPGDVLEIGEFVLRVEMSPPVRARSLWSASAEEMASQEPTGKTGSVGKPLWAASAEEMSSQEPTRKTIALVHR